MKTIRVYYESLEQGYHYFGNIIKNVVKDKSEIVFCRKPSPSVMPEGSIAAIWELTTPDVLITGIDNNIEKPLILVEITEAVTTEDHELQRFNSACAAMLAGAYYLKLSGEKKSEKVFGGANYDPYSSPKILLDNNNYEGYIIAKWETEEGNEYTLKRDSVFMSCPPKIDILNLTVEKAVNAFINDSNNWYDDSLLEIKKSKLYIDYRKLVESASGLNERLTIWKSRLKASTDRVRYFVGEDYVAAKINRFSHAMDPDRGILTYISFLCSDTRNVYGIYALVRPRSGGAMINKVTNLLEVKSQLKAALIKDEVYKETYEGSGEIKRTEISWFGDILIEGASRARSMNDIINIDDLWNKYSSRLRQSKVVMTVTHLLDGIRLNVNGPLLVWDKRKIMGVKKSEFMSGYADRFCFKHYTHPLSIERIVNDVNEDEVTYTLVHKILIPNGFKLVSVSYPGAQGGNAILPFPELGKKQPRIYVDTIALPPKGANFDVFLNESKDMFAEKKVMDDVNKLEHFHTDPRFISALKETLVVAKVIDPDNRVKDIIIGVSFGVRRSTATVWNPGNVDFILRIVDRDEWAIGIFNAALHKTIKSIAGKTSFPTIYSAVKSADDSLF